MAKKTKKAKKTRFVPRMILGSAAIVSVVPAVVALIDCGSDTTSSGPDAGQYAVGQGVAVAAFFDAGQDAGEDATGFTVGVAVAAFFDAGNDAGVDSATDAHGDGSESEGGNDSGEG